MEYGEASACELGDRNPHRYGNDMKQVQSEDEKGYTCYDSNVGGIRAEVHQMHGFLPTAVTS